jgi:protein-S-isoprenylcysteine O-methyltransferase Ste14
VASRLGILVGFPPPGGRTLAFLDHTAAREEKRLTGSRFGAEYRAYCPHVGPFSPRLRRVRHA